MYEGKLLANRYELVEKAGEGGMAEVYRARDRRLGRTVAVKILRPQYAGDADFVRRFQREAQSAASLSHPNVVNVYDIGSEGDLYYIVMEFVEGVTLKELIRRYAPFPPSTAALVADQVAAALEAAHQRGLVHRDIKPHNILITRGGVVKVTDFGIARAAAAVTMTQTGIVLGSVHYFSPEQARGEPAGVASDIYSLGVVLYEMLTGRLPFTGENPVGVALQHLQSAPPPLREWNPKVPRRLEQVVLRCLAKDLHERYSSVSQLRQELQPWVETAHPLTELLAGWRSNAAASSVAATPPADEAGGEQEWAKTRRANAASLSSHLPGSAPVEERLSAAASATGGGGEGTGELPAMGLAAVQPDDPANAAQPEEGDEDGDPTLEQPAVRPSRRRLLWWLTLPALLVVLVVVLQKLPAWWTPPEVRVPNVVGLTQAEAERVLRDQDLHLQIDAEVYSEDKPAGTVISQDPVADTRVRAKRPVHVTLSKGPELVLVPDVVGYTLRQAQAALQDQGLVASEPAYTFSVRIPEGQVVEQSPAASTYLKRGGQVKLVVSQGPPPPAQVSVPDLRDSTVDQARTTLESLGLHVGNIWSDFRPDKPDQVVVDQSPAPGSTAQQGQAVDLLVNQLGAGSSAPAAPGGTFPPSSDSTPSTPGDSTGSTNSNSTEQSGQTGGFWTSLPGLFGGAQAGGDSLHG
ncbi:MAG: Stk1 family PASTA domain-containing Ser/Thr kinase [Limnochordaceae bacterium]|nr:Stk1 family PASTA domain-containing Ser/Thr kinase [Limnochordaceae bacterium]